NKDKKIEQEGQIKDKQLNQQNEDEINKKKKIAAELQLMLAQHLETVAGNKQSTITQNKSKLDKTSPNSTPGSNSQENINDTETTPTPKRNKHRRPRMHSNEQQQYSSPSIMNQQIDQSNSPGSYNVYDTLLQSPILSPFNKRLISDSQGRPHHHIHDMNYTQQHNPFQSYNIPDTTQSQFSDYFFQRPDIQIPPLDAQYSFDVPNAVRTQEVLNELRRQRNLREIQRQQYYNSIDTSSQFDDDEDDDDLDSQFINSPFNQYSPYNMRYGIPNNQIPFQRQYTNHLQQHHHIHSHQSRIDAIGQGGYMNRGHSHDSFNGYQRIHRRRKDFHQQRQIYESGDVDSSQNMMEQYDEIN
ncbi:MAG: hypothetical protein EZS28_049594, partial [Streblomastix strix]